jgi:hypothetical protein
LVCAEERIAVAAQNTETMQAIFARLSFLTFGEVVAAEVARSMVKIELFIFVSLNLNDVVIGFHLVTRQDAGSGVIPLGRKKDTSAPFY